MLLKLHRCVLTLKKEESKIAASCPTAHSHPNPILSKNVLYEFCLRISHVQRADEVVVGLFRCSVCREWLLGLSTQTDLGLKN